MNYYVLTYTTVKDYLERRTPYREEHINLAKVYYNEGKLILGGALEGPANKALLLFKGETDEHIKKFIESDPYVKNGVVTNWEINEWNVVIGNDKI